MITACDMERLSLISRLSAPAQLQWLRSRMWKPENESRRDYCLFFQTEVLCLNPSCTFVVYLLSQTLLFMTSLTAKPSGLK